MIGAICEVIFAGETTAALLDAIDRDVHDVSEFIGLRGVVEYLEYECGCGQHYPEDPMVGILFHDGRRQEFWREEVALDVDVSPAERAVRRAP